MQKPAYYLGTKTQMHPGYKAFAPVDHWDAKDWDELRAIRPRVLTYVRKGENFKVVQQRPHQTRDVLWLEVNGLQIINIYRDPTLDTLELVCGMVLAGKVVIGGDST